MFHRGGPTSSESNSRRLFLLILLPSDAGKRKRKLDELEEKVETLKRKKENVEKQLKEAKMGKESTEERTAVIQDLQEKTKEQEGRGSLETPWGD